MRHWLLVVGLVWPIGFASAQTFGEITGGEVRDQSGAAASNARRERKSIGEHLPGGNGTPSRSFKGDGRTP